MTVYVEWKGGNTPENVNSDTPNVEWRRNNLLWRLKEDNIFYDCNFYRIKKEDIHKVGTPEDSDYVYWEGENCPEGLTKESNVEYLHRSNCHWISKLKTGNYWAGDKYRVKKSELKNVKQDIKNNVLVPDGYRLLEAGERFDQYSNILMNCKSNLPNKTKGWVDFLTHTARKTVEEDDTLWYCAPLNPKESDSMFLSLLKFKAVRSGLYWWFAEPTKNIGRVGLTTLRYASTVALAGSILYGGHYVVKNKSTLIDKIPSVKLEFK